NAGAVDGGDRRHRQTSHPHHERVEDVAQDGFAVLVQRIRVGQVAAAAEGTSFAANEERARTAGLDRVESSP
ncbi:MAG TPA: hypothetical protein VII79_05740, partial [Candidatus Dormibacteraeota bacterium]